MRKIPATVIVGMILWCRPALPYEQSLTPELPLMMVMKATAFANTHQQTASGTLPHEGTVAADTRVLPLGTQIEVFESGGYDGSYLVTDTGPAVKGMHIDIFMPFSSGGPAFRGKDGPCTGPQTG